MGEITVAWQAVKFGRLQRVEIKEDGTRRETTKEQAGEQKETQESVELRNPWRREWCKKAWVTRYDATERLGNAMAGEGLLGSPRRKSLVTLTW